MGVASRSSQGAPITLTIRVIRVIALLAYNIRVIVGCFHDWSFGIILVPVRDHCLVTFGATIGVALELLLGRYRFTLVLFGVVNARGGWVFFLVAARARRLP